MRSNEFIVVVESWPRLLKEKGKPGWLKLDFDKMTIEDSEKEEEQQQVNVLYFCPPFILPSLGGGVVTL